METHINLDKLIPTQKHGSGSIILRGGRAIQNENLLEVAKDPKHAARSTENLWGRPGKWCSGHKLQQSLIYFVEQCFSIRVLRIHCPACFMRFPAAAHLEYWGGYAIIQISCAGAETNRKYEVKWPEMLVSIYEELVDKKYLPGNCSDI